MDRVRSKNRPHQSRSREEHDHIARFEMIYAFRGMNNRHLPQGKSPEKLAKRQASSRWRDIRFGVPQSNGFLSADDHG